MKISSTLATIGLQAGSALLGHCLGMLVHYPGRPPSIYTVLGLIAWSLMLVGAGITMFRRDSPEARRCRAVTVATAAYAAAVILWEPFLEPSQNNLCVPVVALVPLLFAIGELRSAHAWASLAGVTLFIFTCTAMLSSNARVCDAGSGFFAAWFE